MMPVENEARDRNVAERVAAILAKSAAEPGIKDMLALIRLTDEVSAVQAVYTEMSNPHETAIQFNNL